MKGDQLMPVVTLTILFAPQAWDAPVSIHEMFGTQDARALSFVPDYRINLIAPALMKDSNWGKFKTSLKEVLSFIKYSSDKDKLGEVLAAEEGFRSLGRDEVDVLNACVGAKLAIKEGEEVMEVCVAIEEMKKEAAQEAAKEAASKERASTLLSNIENLMETMGWSAEHAMDMLKVSASDRELLPKSLTTETI